MRRYVIVGYDRKARPYFFNGAGFGARDNLMLIFSSADAAEKTIRKTRKRFPRAIVDARVVDLVCHRPREVVL